MKTNLCWGEILEQSGESNQQIEPTDEIKTGLFCGNGPSGLIFVSTLLKKGTFKP